VKVIRKRVRRRRAQSATNDQESVQKYNEAFKNEMALLRLLRRLNHPNIVPLLGSYTYNDEHNFLFPCFEMDLAQFLQLDERFGEFRWDFMFPLALCGLASALEHTHDLHLTMEENGLNYEAIGYHYDFRPANILVSKSSYVLSDFGLGKMKPAEENSETLWKVGAGDYIAPECRDASFVHQHVGRSIDVWAFGCLVTEVITYMERGARGVRDFRQSRLEDFIPGWETTYFFDSKGKLKNSVRQWLEELGNTTSSSTKQIMHIATQAFEPDPKIRPRISRIRNELAHQTLKFLLSDILRRLEAYMDSLSVTEEEQSESMRLWFERERLRAFGKALILDFENDQGIFHNVRNFRICCDTMIEISRKIQFELDPKQDQPAESRQFEKPLDLRGSFGDQIQKLVQNLWDLLPHSYSRKVQATWLQSMQKDDLEKLNDIDKFLQNHRREDLNDMGPLAHMRAIQLQMINDPTVGAAEFLHPRECLDRLIFKDGHTYGLFQNSQRVLVEWMYFSREWTKIPQAQRMIIMELRAKDFNTDPKPQGLRILKCLGFVEQSENQGRRQGFGFIYELPHPAADLDGNNGPVSLRRLLLQGQDRVKGAFSQAPLRGRLQLAYSLALFFADFYTVGCLHESFNSNNVIFARGLENFFDSDTIWSFPYIVGFQKSRPEGQNWATEGPSGDFGSQDFEHPEYRDKRRFVLEYDYYSLGMVLLEIGLWYPLQSWSERKEYRTLSPKQFRAVLVEKYVPRLSFTVGKVYRNTVRACLDGTLESTRGNSPSAELDSKVFSAFLHYVVKPLEELSLLRI
jgi:serine/threonine protein kinase